MRSAPSAQWSDMRKRVILAAGFARLLLAVLLGVALVAGAAEPPKGKNRLVFESSPYLLQHAGNPVNWYPWGDDAIAKARAVAPRFPGALIIGCDQVASCEGTRLGKPDDYANALRQLQAMSGKTATFDTAVSVLDAASGRVGSRVVPCRVTFRELGRAQIEDYLRREQPYDCAGSAKSEGLGIALIARIDTEDPTSLIGLPLIALTGLLAEAGLPVIRA